MCGPLNAQSTAKVISGRHERYQLHNIFIFFYTFLYRRVSVCQVHAVHFRVSTIHRTLAWTTGSLTCVRSYACVYTDTRVAHTDNESAHHVDSEPRNETGCARQKMFPQDPGHQVEPSSDPREKKKSKTDDC